MYYTTVDDVSSFPRSTDRLGSEEAAPPVPADTAFVREDVNMWRVRSRTRRRAKPATNRTITTAPPPMTSTASTALASMSNGMMGTVRSY